MNVNFIIKNDGLSWHPFGGACLQSHLNAPNTMQSTLLRWPTETQTTLCKKWGEELFVLHKETLKEYIRTKERGHLDGNGRGRGRDRVEVRLFPVYLYIYILFVLHHRNKKISFKLFLKQNKSKLCLNMRPLYGFSQGLAVASTLVDISQQMPIVYKEKSGAVRNRKQQPPAQPGTCIWCWSQGLSQEQVCGRAEPPQGREQAGKRLCGTGQKTGNTRSLPDSSAWSQAFFDGFSHPCSSI